MYELLWAGATVTVARQLLGQPRPVPPSVREQARAGWGFTDPTVTTTVTEVRAFVRIQSVPAS